MQDAVSSMDETRSELLVSLLATGMSVAIDSPFDLHPCVKFVVFIAQGGECVES